MKKLTIILFTLINIYHIGYGQTFDWVNFVRCGNVYEEGRVVKLDATRNIYSAGTFVDSAVFYSSATYYSLPAFGKSDIFIKKTDPQGNDIWLKHIGSSGKTQVNDIAIDKSSNVYITGFFHGKVDFDPGVGQFFLHAITKSDAFLLKLDSAGNFIWAVKFSSSQDDEGISVDVDDLGNVYSTGDYDLIVDFDPGIDTFNLNSDPGNASYIVKLDSGGNFIWAKSINHDYNTSVVSIAIDKSSNILLKGYFQTTVDFDPGPGVFDMTPTIMQEVFIMKLDSSGNYKWAKQCGTQEWIYKVPIAFDSLGNLYLAGGFGNSSGIQCDFDFGPGAFLMTSNGSSDIYIQKVDSSGNFIWARQIGAASQDYALSIAVDSALNVYATGHISPYSVATTVDFDPGPGIFNLTVYPGDTKLFLEKLDQYGSFINALEINKATGAKILIDNAGNLILSGQFYDGSADFDPGPGIYTAGPSYMNGSNFVLKLSKDICALSMGIDSTMDKTCLQPGYARAVTYNASAPHSYQWNTNPVTYDSVAYFNLPGIYSVNYTDTNNCYEQRSVLINGPIFSNGYDLNTTFAVGTFVPGISTLIFLNGFNDGCTPVTGTLSMVLDSLVNYNSAMPSPDIISGDTLTWNFTNLVYNGGQVSPVISVATSTAAVFNDDICFYVIILPDSSDNDSYNNYKNYCFTVTGSYDPNDKNVYPKGACEEKYLLNSEKLNYTIRFQNTGSAAAKNIFITDTLDANVDINSIRVIAHSHPLITEVLPGNVLKFKFDNIMLPDSNANEPASHGYVVYTAQMMPGIANNTEVKNTANIYFDNNQPVLTNTVLNTVVDSIPVCIYVGISQTEQKNKLIVAPNPCTDYLDVKINGTIEKTNAVVYDIAGKKIFSQIVVNASSFRINTKAFPQGIYLLLLESKSERNKIVFLKN